MFETDFERCYKSMFGENKVAKQDNIFCSISWPSF